MSALSPRQMFLLDEACKPLRQAFDATPYLVGSAADMDDLSLFTGIRDVDVRLMLDDEIFDALRAAIGQDAITMLGLTLGEYLAGRTGLPIDFQFQRVTEANARHGNKPRNPLGLRHLSEYRGDAAPEPAKGCSKG